MTLAKLNVTDPVTDSSPKKVPLLSPYIAKILLDPAKGPAAAYQAHYLLGNAPRKKPTPAQQMGKVVDRLVFGIGPEIRTSSRKKNDPGEILCPAVDSKEPAIRVPMSVWGQAEAIAKAAKAGFSERQIPINKAQAQLKWYWESQGEVRCSGRPDLIVLPGLAHELDIIDLKTCRDLSDTSLRRDIEAYGYDQAAAAYLEAGTAVYGISDVGFKWLFVEKEIPYQTRLITASPTMVGQGMAKWLKAVTIWKDCLATNQWSGPVDGEIQTREQYNEAKADEWLNS